MKFASARVKIRYLLMIAMGVSMLTPAARAQGTQDSWNKLRTLERGHRIQVVEQNLRSQDGTFLSVSDAEISFQVEQNGVTLQRDEVLRVNSREHLGRGQKALIGLGIGAGLGAATGAIVGARCGYGDSCVATGAVLFGAVGAGVGALLPAGHPTIYRAEPSQGP